MPDDNRLENLRIVCPNCAAGLDTHCGRKNVAPPEPARCRLCGREFVRRRTTQRYCSPACGATAPRPGNRRPRPERRKADRPPYEQLLAEVRALGFSAVGRRYGVSDHAIRKWVRQYERERAASSGADVAA